MSQATNKQETTTANEVVSNSAILESIQNIMKVMQQQLMFNSKTAEQTIIQTASLFQGRSSHKRRWIWILLYSQYLHFRKNQLIDQQIRDIGSNKL